MSAYTACATEIAGCIALHRPPFHDARGSFLKTFHQPEFTTLGLDFAPEEVFVTTSAAGVVRGLHCQWPPKAHAKLVQCVTGAVFDVVLDLRRGSATFGHHLSRQLDAGNGQSLFIPAGCAHGFAVLEAPATLIYLTSCPHDPAHDGGVRWDSAGIAWPISTPVVSARDRALPALCDLQSPFHD